jgi:K+-transporting ATPase c subunit
MPEERLTKLINQLAEGKQLGFLGPLYVNIHILNQALDLLQK